MSVLASTLHHYAKKRWRDSSKSSCSHTNYHEC